MASSTDVTFATWDSKGWDIQYKGTGKISVSRAAGAATATVTGSASIMSYGGDQVGWKLHMKVGNNAEVTADFKKTGHGAYWDDTTGRWITNYDTASVSQPVSVGDSSGSLSVQLWVTVEDGYGTSSSVQSATVTYDSRGSAIINSCADMTIGNAVSISWTAYSTSLYYEFKITCGDFTAWTGRKQVSATGSQTFTGYTVPASIAAYLGSAAKSGTVTVTLYTYTGTTGGAMGSSSKDVTVYTTKAVAPTMQTSWTLVESNTSNPFKDSNKNIGADGTYRFVKEVTKFKLTVYAYSKYNSPPTTLYGYLVKAANAFSTSFSSTGTKTSDGYAIYKAEAYIPATSDGSEVLLKFGVYDARGYYCPVVSNGTFTAVAQTSEADGDRAYVKVNISAYILPQIKDLTLNVSGTTVYVVATTQAINVVNTSSTSINSLTAKLMRKKISTGASTTVDVSSKLGFGLKRDITIYAETLSDVATESYEYTLVLSDKYTSDTESKSTGVVALSLYKGGKGAAFFREATAEGLQIKGNTVIQSPTTGNTLWNFTEASDASYSTLGLSTPSGDVAQTIEFRNVGNATPELIGWDDFHNAYTFRASYWAFYAIRSLKVTTNGNDDTEYLGAYYNTTESMLEFQNIGHTAKMFLTMNGSTSGLPKMYIYDGTNATTLAAINKNSAYITPWKGIGGVNKPVYFDPTYGMPKACDPLSDMFQVKSVSFETGYASESGGTTGEKYLDLSSQITGNWKAIALAGYWVSVARTTSDSYAMNADCRITPSEIILNTAYNRLYACLVNEGSTGWYTKVTARLLCIYTG